MPVLRGVGYHSSTYRLELSLRQPVRGSFRWELNSADELFMLRFVPDTTIETMAQIFQALIPLLNENYCPLTFGFPDLL